ncbi:unnamed protein product, partial [Laminaria digitata]
MASSIRIGLIGLGRHGLRYAQHLAAGDVPQASLGAVWTRDAEKRGQLAERFGVVNAPTLQALAESDVQA